MSRNHVLVLLLKKNYQFWISFTDDTVVVEVEERLYKCVIKKAYNCNRGHRVVEFNARTNKSRFKYDYTKVDALLVALNEMLFMFPFNAFARFTAIRLNPDKYSDFRLHYQSPDSHKIAVKKSNTEMAFELQEATKEAIQETLT